ncbi:uncharacterized protein A1O5_05543 [Cladophialophora psammophila CBS 110553]|uniref:Uncharacterized protein n=1 Tax=Cladophialophora psammophila CBS 110553 TaxID=1182543 RepID=W9XN04_9EURO|nr:uncharacterized protein A1O5_05543 [Cladophialophora psammophila CBS 110553]EXJ71734.1 hypothetical protein A1O5_05543 [Cladophialophora psammophila CBS 110553]
MEELFAPLDIDDEDAADINVQGNSLTPLSSPPAYGETILHFGEIDLPFVPIVVVATCILCLGTQICCLCSKVSTWAFHCCFLTCHTPPGDPFHGSYNLAYVIEFNENIERVARVPIQGTGVREADIDKLNTDYTSLRYIRSTLDMPVPELFWFETSCDRVGVPFALMSFVSGESVCLLWHDKEWITEEKRLKILTNLVHVMVKLDKKTVSHIGPLHTVIEADEEYIEHGLTHVDKCGPFNTLDEWLGHNPDTFEGVPETALSAKRCLEADRFQIDFWDYNYQNIFIGDDCNITGILDWDGIRAVPQGMGCTRYPSCITRDWDPGSYEPALDGNWEDSMEDPPEVLSRYRKHYADTFAGLGLQYYGPRETKLSHILEAINIATGDQFARQYIMIVLLNHAYGCSDPPGNLPKIGLRNIDRSPEP